MVSALTFSGYDLTEVLHEGVNTVVYRGQTFGQNSQLAPQKNLQPKAEVPQTQLHPVVLKILKAEYPTLEQISRLKQEYKITESLILEGIVRVYELHSYQNRLALVYEDFGGQSLKRLLKQQALPPIAFLKIAVQLAQALLSLHQHGILHKDIKPANIIFNPETGQVKLTDFSIASRLDKEMPLLTNPNQLEGTLAYMSPEQTGRMNRSVDYRSDFYSLGITFYEMLTGRLPFQGSDPMELVHAHIAKPPPALRHLNPEVPLAIATIVEKLMAKNAEDRYQSAAGLKVDLEFCLDWLQSGGQSGGDIPELIPGARDRAGQFLIPQKLYGREPEVAELLAAFERISGEPALQPRSELMLVSGYSGIGKSSLVHEVHKPIARQRGYFISGKFDQFKRNIPYASLIQAFQSLMQMLLTEPADRLQRWQDNLLKAIGRNGQVIIDVIPEVELIIGSQPPLPELGASEAQNRFNRVFQSFIQVFTQPEHPLVLFLDDLQWADSASLNLIQVLMSDPASQYLLLIGAYRDNEVSPIHPLVKTLEDIQQAGVAVNNIVLSPLTIAHVQQIVADTLSHLQPTQALAELLFNKTQGNPFFLTQLLKTLHQEHLLTFDFAQGIWQWNLEKIQTTGIADKSVVDLMAGNIEKLPEVTQTALKLAACVGDRFNINVLATVSETPALEMAQALQPALQSGLVLPLNNDYKIPLLFADDELDLWGFDPTKVTYRFLHDRVQQAAYSLIPDADKQITHLKMGRLLLQSTSPQELEAQVFEIVNALNRGADLMDSPTERIELARLNLIAGQKAKAAAAYDPSVSYLSQGIALLPSESWRTDYALTLALCTEAAEAAYLSTDYGRSTQWLHQIEHHAASTLDKVKAYELKIQCHIAQLQMWEAIALGLDTLAMLGIPIACEMGRPHDSIRLPDLAELEHSPEMTDPIKLAALQILSTLTSAAYQTQPEIYRWIVLTQLELCVEYGHSALAAFAYTAYAWFCGAIQMSDRAYHSGQIALKLIEQFQAKELECSFYQLFESFVKHQKEHIRETFAPLQKSIHIGLETGDIGYVSYSAMNLGTHLFFSGNSLESVIKTQSHYIDLLLKLKQEFQIYYMQLWQQVMLNLQGKAIDPCRLMGDSFDETIILPRLQIAQNQQSLFAFYTAQLILNYTFEQYPRAVEKAALAEQYAGSGAGLVLSAVYRFYHALALLADSDADGIRLGEAIAHQQVMQKWAESAPMNYQHKYDLVNAEIARIEDRKYEAMQAYDLAIQGAMTYGYYPEAALASELAAKFYLAQGKKHIAQGYMTDAYYGYIRWGAIAKVHQLEEKYAPLIVSTQQTALPVQATETLVANRSYSANGSTNSQNILDLTTVMKAAQTISSELNLHQLLEKLLGIILENAAAQTGALILEKNGQLLIEAIAHNANQSAIVLQSVPVETSPDLPASLISYVARTRQSLVLKNAIRDPISEADPYIIQHQPKSILCNPILYQGKLIGILYLENHLIAGAFSRDRLELLGLLTTQAAIAIENAYLYTREQEKSQQLQDSFQQVQQAQLQLVQNEKMAALGNLVAGVAHEINNPVGFLKGSLRNAEEYIQELLAHVDCYQCSYPDPSPAVQNHAEEIDLDFLARDLPKMLSSMKGAIERIRNISTSLRTFSRLDTDQRVACDIHEGIESTLLILKYRLQANENRSAVKVIKQYGDLPKVECFPGQLNQVFMNILANAIDALDECNQDDLTDSLENQTITIKTALSADQNQVVVQIRDNGIGIPEEIRSRIFSHLFTTKEVGKGTGLGLSIARQIVEETHGGHLSCHSELGQGTEFVIELPIASAKL
ncbi:MAG: AAA family ATPase [Drouetiella hepatica Uher 2000/2452]|jgi:predicted ATPase/signal transduction histidine kinase|uniref:histidine kinase n=1 Tax=Drouetiella hepatica Uher 2000/2452 TaxID=904376 RepID=A0A951QDA7_9CYAN|nr:AAA family ATPase [Drouetiella hepatica Uher 2000/2452]